MAIADPSAARLGWPHGVASRDAYETAERERRKALPWRERYGVRDALALAMLIAAVAAVVYACIR